MTTTFEPKFGSWADFTAATDAFVGIADGSTFVSDVIDNTADLNLDALVTVLSKSVTTPGNDKCLYVYAYGWDGAVYTDGITPGTKITGAAPVNMRLIGVVGIPTTGDKVAGPFSVAAAFGGILPDKWGVAVYNKNNNAIAASSTIKWLGLQAQGA